MQIAGTYLFGSHLTGKADEWSDIDLAVISPQIGPDHFEERVRLTKIALAIDDRIEPHPFSPDSFTPDNPLVREILRTGLRVRSKNRQKNFARCPNCRRCLPPKKSPETLFFGLRSRRFSPCCSSVFFLFHKVLCCNHPPVYLSIPRCIPHKQTENEPQRAFLTA